MVNLCVLVSNFIVAFSLHLKINCGIEWILLWLSIIVEIGHLIHHILTKWFSRSVTNEGLVEKFCGFLFRVTLCLLRFEYIFLWISPFSLSFALSWWGLQCHNSDGTHGPFLIMIENIQQLFLNWRGRMSKSIPNNSPIASIPVFIPKQSLPILFLLHCLEMAANSLDCLRSHWEVIDFHLKFFTEDLIRYLIMPLSRFGELFIRVILLTLFLNNYAIHVSYPQFAWLILFLDQNVLGE